MDPKHRDRLAFIKIVSGTFERKAVLPRTSKRT
jgi:peptide subunit release factor RF-3